MERILRSLFALDPPTVGAVEEILGLSFDDSALEMGSMGSFWWRKPAGDVEGLSVGYWWDMYHDEPVTTLERLRSRTVVDCTIDFARNKHVIEAALSQRFGAPRLVPGHRVFDRWLLKDGRTEDACSLVYCRKLPDWAVEGPNPEVRARFLLDLTAGLANAATLPTPSVPAGSGVVASGTAGREISLEFVPRMDALELVRLLGWPNAIGESTDVHMSSFRIALVVGASAYGPVTVAPTYGRWAVRAALAERPSGPDLANNFPGPTARKHLVAGDLVAFFEIAQARG